MNVKTQFQLSGESGLVSRILCILRKKNFDGNGSASSIIPNGAGKMVFKAIDFHQKPSSCVEEKAGYQIKF